MLGCYEGFNTIFRQAALLTYASRSMRQDYRLATIASHSSVRYSDDALISSYRPSPTWMEGSKYSAALIVFWGPRDIPHDPWKDTVAGFQETESHIRRHVRRVLGGCVNHGRCGPSTSQYRFHVRMLFHPTSIKRPFPRPSPTKKPRRERWKHTCPLTSPPKSKSASPATITDHVLSPPDIGQHRGHALCKSLRQQGHQPGLYWLRIAFDSLKSTSDDSQPSLAAGVARGK